MLVEKTETFPRLVPRATECDTRETVDLAADDVSQRVARERVERKQNDVGEQDQRTNPDSEAAIKPERVNRVVPENDQEDERNVEKVAMQVLQDEWKGSLAAIPVRAAFADCARGRIEKERAVVSLAIVVTGGAKTQGATQDENRR